VLSGVSSGGFLSQARAMISSVLYFTVSPKGASSVVTRAVTLSNACKTATA